jgi:hypothetical protein
MGRGESLDPQATSDSFAGECLGFAAGGGVGDQDGARQRQDMAVAGFGTGGSRPAMGLRKGADDLGNTGCDGVADGGAERRGRTPALRGAGENDGDGCAAPQQDSQHVPFNRSMEAADDRRALGDADVGPILRPQDHVAGAGLGAEEGDRFTVQPQKGGSLSRHRPRQCPYDT